MDEELKKYIDEFIAGSPDPVNDLLKLVGQFHHNQLVTLQAEIADLKQKLKKFE